jgi:hypothetical protein
MTDRQNAFMAFGFPLKHIVLKIHFLPDPCLQNSPLRVTPYNRDTMKGPEKSGPLLLMKPARCLCSEHLNGHFLSLQQLQCQLRRLVGLGQHSRRSLLQDLVSGEIG